MKWQAPETIRDAIMMLNRLKELNEMIRVYDPDQITLADLEFKDSALANFKQQKAALLSDLRDLWVKLLDEEQG